MKEDAPRLPILGFRALTRKIFSLPFLTPSDRSERKQSFLPAQLFFFPFHSNDTEANFECMYAYILPEMNKLNRWCTIVKQNDTKFYIFNGPRNFQIAVRHYGSFHYFVSYRVEFNIVPSAEYRDENLIIITYRKKKKHGRFGF